MHRCMYVCDMSMYVCVGMLVFLPDALYIWLLAALGVLSAINTGIFISLIVVC